MRKVFFSQVRNTKRERQIDAVRSKAAMKERREGSLSAKRVKSSFYAVMIGENAGFHMKKENLLRILKSD